MIQAVASGVIDPVTGAANLTISFTGFELFLGSILGALTAVVVWITMKNFAG